MAVEQIRSFIAIELPDELRRALGRLEAQLKAGTATRVRWVDPNSIHLTLKFLGNAAADATGEIVRAMEETVQGMPPLHLKAEGTGVFPNVRRPQVAWVGLSGEVARLLQLQQRLESNLAPLGFAPEGRAFTPHLTLARLDDRMPPDERRRFAQMVIDSRFDGGTIKVSALSLMRSQLTRAGAIYSRLGLVALSTSLKEFTM